MPRRAVAIGQRCDTGNIAEAVGADVVAGCDEQHARHAARRGRVDALDMRMRDRRTQHETIRRVRKRHIVGIAPAAGDETQILVTPHRLADAEFHAVSSSFRCVAFSNGRKMRINFVEEFFGNR